MPNNEAESKDDQSSVPKSKLSKWNFQQSWLEMYKWLKFDLPKGMFSLLRLFILETYSWYSVWIIIVEVLLYTHCNSLFADYVCVYLH